jgi:hypothetical protein
MCATGTISVQVAAELEPLVSLNQLHISCWKPVHAGFGMLLLLWPLTWEAAISLKEALKA